ncbi:MAG: histidinol-phosphatase HisJ family protein [Clostridia bacterium]|nr:histidinol-phosphatase HisJ family protein [Clostridia bacterium]
MFDYHLHTKVSFDARATAQEVIEKALQLGLKEICFTDHVDYIGTKKSDYVFDLNEYSRAYDNLKAEGLKIRRGMEFGLNAQNVDILEQYLKLRNFDFVIGSVHFINDVDCYYGEYWKNKSVHEAYEEYLTETLKMVKIHSNFDVLGHLTYITKAKSNPTKEVVDYQTFKDIIDEILLTLAKKGRGIEVNTSGVKHSGEFLPPLKMVKRFKELGGEIVTVGSDAHDQIRVGEHTFEAVNAVKQIFGYVCTFENRKPIFHK